MKMTLLEVDNTLTLKLWYKFCNTGVIIVNYCGSHWKVFTARKETWSEQIIKRCDGEGSEGKLLIPLGKGKEITSEYDKEY